MDAKQPSPTSRPAALDGLLAHITRRIKQIEADTHAGHDRPTAPPPSGPHHRKER